MNSKFGKCSLFSLKNKINWLMEIKMKNIQIMCIVL